MGENLVIGGKRPAEMSHPWITNCTSCHVPADGMRQFTEPREARLVVENSFIGKTLRRFRAPGLWHRAAHHAASGLDAPKLHGLPRSGPRTGNPHLPSGASELPSVPRAQRCFRQPGNLSHESQAALGFADSSETMSAISRRDLFRSMFGRRPQHVEPPVEETIRTGSCGR